MGDAEHRQVTWNGYHSHIEKVVNDAYNDMEFSDMVIMAKDEPLTAHKIVLAGCSDYMRRAIKAGKQDQQLLFVFPSIESHIIKLVLEYMYTGEVTMHHTDVVDFMKVGEELKVKGLCDTQEKRTYNVVPDYQTNLKLGIVHSSYLAKQFASTTANQRLQQQLLQQQLGDRKRVSSPPPLKKRKRSITSHDNKLPAPASLPAIQVPDNINTMTAAATAAVTSETETAAAFSLPAIVSAQPFVDVNTLHLALQQRQIQLQQQQQQQQQLLRTPDTSSSDALPNSSLLNSSSSSDLNPLPLVKVEMTEEEEGDTTMAADEAPSSDSTSSNTTESASRAADAGAAAGATGGGAAHQPMDSDLPSTDIKSENVHEDERNGDDAQDPLESSCNGEETPLGGRLSPSGESAANESGTSESAASTSKVVLQQKHSARLPSSCPSSSSCTFITPAAVNTPCGLVITTVESLSRTSMNSAAANVPSSVEAVSVSSRQQSAPNGTDCDPSSASDVRTKTDKGSTSGESRKQRKSVSIANIFANTNEITVETCGPNGAGGSSSTPVSVTMSHTQSKDPWVVLGPIKPDVEIIPVHAPSRKPAAATGADESSGCLSSDCLVEIQDLHHKLMQHAQLQPSALDQSQSPYFTGNHSIFHSVGAEKQQQQSLLEHASLSAEEVVGDPAALSHHQIQEPAITLKTEDDDCGLDDDEFMTPAAAAAGFEMAAAAGGEAPHYYAKTAFICPECGKCFDSSFSLTVHTRSHSEDRPHQCPHCDYRAKLKHHIKCHVKRRHADASGACDGDGLLS